MKNMRRLFLTVGIILFASFAAYGYEGPAAKKLIYFGWSGPTTVDEILKTDLEDFDRNCPFDGMGIAPWIKLHGDENTEYSLSRVAGEPRMLSWDDFKEWVTALRRLQQETQLKHNFIRTNCAAFNGNWFDDEVWKRTLNNYGMMARLAKESGFEGLCLDLEGYAVTKRPFMFREELGYSFEETAAQVRKRGKEWIEEINRQFPNLTLFTFLWTSLNCDTPNRAAHPETNNTGRDALLTAFFNGVYDGAPETMKIIDGQEGQGYCATTDFDYDRIVANYHRFADAWIDKANHAKFKKITSMGMSLYLDSYAKKDKKTPWDHHNDSFSNQTTLLAHNVMNTLACADEYAWIWCEWGTFWPNAEFNKYKPGVRKPFKYWNEVIPGCVEAIRFGKDWAKGIPSLAGKDVLRNGTLEPGESGIKHGVDQSNSGIIGWSSWQNSQMPKGTITPENGMVHFVNVTDGSIAQSFKNPKPGKKFIFTARCKSESRFSIPRIGYFFRGKNGQGLWDIQETNLFDEKDADGWMRSHLLITVPEGRDITEMTVIIGVQGSQNPSGKDGGVYFDDAALYEVEYPWEQKTESTEDK